MERKLLYLGRKDGEETVGESVPKYQQLLESLKAEIAGGRYAPGQKLPSEAALVQRSGASRITVGRAMRELQNLGLVVRVAGSGSFVSQPEGDKQTFLFGLLIPDLGETEIFEPICQGIANAPAAGEHALIWGHSDKGLSKTQQAWRLCQQYVAKKVAGVFFAPLEFEAEAERTNRRILNAFEEVGIAVVLLDRRNAKARERKRPDLVGINSRQAGYVATEHLIEVGCDHIAFLGYGGSASTITERMAGFQEALEAHGMRPAMDQLTIGDVEGKPAAKMQAAEGMVCVNDRMAGQLMHVFLARGIRIPEDVRLVGIDDVSYASLLPVPLTTVRQPTREIGEAALHAMLERIRLPHLPPREVLLDGELIIRRSCGAD